jgi:hypothetical protein
MIATASPEIDVRGIAMQALAMIARVETRNRYASRKGIVVGTKPFRQKSIAFRRVDGTVRMEVWTYSGGWPQGITHHKLPPYLERRAGEMLDSL